MIITKYNELTQYLNAFKTGDIPLLIVRSDGGHGKSYYVKTSLKGVPTNIFSGHATPLAVYKTLYHNPDYLTIFDDVDEILHNKTMVALLKQICELDEQKPVRYASTSPLASDVDDEFTSRNKVLLLMNDVKQSGKHLGALMTRAIFIDFRPSNKEVFEQLRGFATDKEILSFIDESLADIKSFNFRVYEKSKNLKDAGLDWREYIQKEFKFRNYTHIIREVMSLPVSERNKIWTERTGLSERRLRQLIKTIKK